MSFTQVGDVRAWLAVPISTPVQFNRETNISFRAASTTLQGRAKLMELSLVTHVPSGPIGYAWAGHFAWQK